MTPLRTAEGKRLLHILPILLFALGFVMPDHVAAAKSVPLIWMPDEEPALQPPIITAVAAGWEHTCALTEDGGVKCWGSNYAGQLGDGTREPRATPVDVLGLATGVEAIAVGVAHTCALMSNGGVKCWGDDYSGQLGDGDGTETSDLSSSTPVDVSGLTTGVKALAAGNVHTCALLIDGGVKCWGDNFYGQLGNGTVDGSPTPVDVVGLTSGIQALAAGAQHTCAVTTAGGVKCWGDNEYAQLGDNNCRTYKCHLTPVGVEGLSGVQALAAGQVHTCALLTNGSVKCWGYNDAGQLGGYTDPYNLVTSTPVEVVGLAGGAQAIAAGVRHTCALMANGAVKCWGINTAGQVGSGSGGPDCVAGLCHRTAVDVVGLTDGMKALSAGALHSCAVSTAGGVKCWGDNSAGQLGNGTAGNGPYLTPMNVVGGANGVQALTAGTAHTCLLTTAGGAKCWGANDLFQLGDSTAKPRATPVDVTGLITGVQALAAGGGHTCALTTTGGVKCWGTNAAGSSFGVPADVAGLSSGVQALAAGAAHACALTVAGGVKCWGTNNSGQVGDGSKEIRTTPVDVAGLSSGVQVVSAGGEHTCALTTTGGVKCWGDNTYGQVGDGTTEDRLTPVDVVGLDNGVKMLAAGGLHTCVLTTIGGVKCWGTNRNGQVGDGTAEDRFTPVAVAGLTSGVQAIAAGGEQTCAFMANGGVKCWGDNAYGQVGDGTTEDRFTAVHVAGLNGGVQALAAGRWHTCIVTTSGGVMCWGDDRYDQAGDGVTKTYAAVPVDVVWFDSPSANGNEPPTFTSQPVTVAHPNFPYVYELTTSDPNTGDTRTIAALDKPNWLAFTDHSDGTATLAGTPTVADVGDHAVLLEVKDAAGATATQAFTLTVTASAPTDGIIQGVAFVDSDHDKQQSAAEPGLSGVTVTLEGETVVYHGQTTTDANGAYRFNSVPAGSYRLTLMPPDGFAPMPMVISLHLDAGETLILPVDFYAVAPLSPGVFLPLVRR